MATNSQPIGNPKRSVLDPDRVIEAIESDESVGFCINCGEERDGCEPDARKYPCDNCGQRQVYGAAELLLMGMVS